MESSRRPGSPARWSLQDAKNKLSAVVKAAAKGQPQIVTRRGVETAVVISYDEYERIRARGRRSTPTLAEYLLEVPPAAGGDDAFERIELRPRDDAF